ncbi:MAG: hypothetical protein O9289_19940 [Rhodobacteraceae bacterium]|nr:hypothetical protein [Paracoccaceae bacterium]MCZ8085476.1 hypothetical protein [Paracoccaceae bacterium]
MRVAFLVLSAVLFLCLLPVLSTLGAGIIANAAGCDLDAAGIHPCRILGADWGEALYIASFLAWFGLVTLPFAALAALGIILLALVRLIRYLRR